MGRLKYFPRKKKKISSKNYFKNKTKNALKFILGVFCSSSFAKQISPNYPYGPIVWRRGAILFYLLFLFFVAFFLLATFLFLAGFLLATFLFFVAFFLFLAAMLITSFLKRKLFHADKIINFYFSSLYIIQKYFFLGNAFL